MNSPGHAMRCFLLLILPALALSGCRGGPQPFLTSGEAIAPFGLKTYQGPFVPMPSPAITYSYEDLQSVQSQAQRRHRYVPDREEFWQDSLEGDCEDYAIHVHLELARRGIPSHLVLARAETGEVHIVVSVDGWILDNRHFWVRPREELPYEWFAQGGLQGEWGLIADEGSTGDRR